MNLDYHTQVHWFAREQNPLDSNLNVYQWTARQKAVTTTAEIAGKYTTFHKRGDHRIEWNAACGTRAEQDVLHMALQRTAVYEQAEVDFSVLVSTHHDYQDSF